MADLGERKGARRGRAEVPLLFTLKLSAWAAGLACLLYVTLNAL